MASGVVLSESAEDGKVRFELEAEFVSFCADPTYLQFLGSQGLLAKASFIKWLRYLLKTWSTPAYAAHLRHPLGLTHLHQLVHDEEFRERMCKFDQAILMRQAELDLWKGKAEALETARVVAAHSSPDAGTTSASS